MAAQVESQTTAAHLGVLGVTEAQARPPPQRLAGSRALRKKGSQALHRVFAARSAEPACDRPPAAPPPPSPLPPVLTGHVSSLLPY